jgi:hypothetical protein
MQMKDIDAKEKALVFVEEFELRNGRNPKRVDRSGHDIESDERRIEVKGRGRGWENVVLEPQSYEKMKETENYYLYVVANVNSEEKSEWEFYVLDRKAVEKYGVEYNQPSLAVRIWKADREKYRVL